MWRDAENPSDLIDLKLSVFEELCLLRRNGDGRVFHTCYHGAVIQVQINFMKGSDLYRTRSVWRRCCEIQPFDMFKDVRNVAK